LTARARTTRRTQATATAVLLAVLFACAALAAAPAKRTAAHGGVSLTFDEALAREVKAETAPAAPLENADEKPDGVYPEHVAFTLVDVKGAPAESFNEPVIRVCPVAEYLKAFSVSPAYVRDARRTLGELRGLIRRHPAALKGNVPARVKYLRFRGGAGIAFLTQAQQDDELLNSQHASYSFRGLTDDGRFYVTADLPVGARALAATRDTPSHEGYSLLNRPGDRREARRYAAYVERVRLKLERLSPEQFSPGLNLYDELLSSLEIRK
jgi:hypothetical protein